MTTEPEFDANVCVIGAGPAGMAAAITATRHGASVIVLDEQPAPGGQIYRAVTSGSLGRAGVLGADYSTGHKLAERFTASDATWISDATVWRITPIAPAMPRLAPVHAFTPSEPATDQTRFEVIYSRGGRAHAVTARRLILATGAIERPFPIPGWTLPGVITAGAGQILLKQSGIVPTDAVLAGSGPLLYLLATQLIRAGAPPRALVETAPDTGWLPALGHLPRALLALPHLAKGLAMLAEIRRAGIPRFRNASELTVQGTDAVAGLAFKVGANRHEIPCTSLLLHVGVVPNVQFSRALRLVHDWHDGQRCWHPRTDAWGTTSHPGIAIAGDGDGIGGAIHARHQGHIAALEALRALGVLTLDERNRYARRHRRARLVERSIRPFLDRLYAPPRQALAPDDKTIVCRCESVTAGELRRFARLGCLGPNQVKAHGRAGMGPCQGRTCGLVVSEILARANRRTMEQTGYLRLRMPIKPVTLAEMASLAPPDDASAEP
jgi:NADPH-dependent 2,4-dienoyl-CoA reductase/sulfur reductase-like enzyme